MYSDIGLVTYEQFLQLEKVKFQERYKKIQRNTTIKEEINNFEVFQGLRVGGVASLALIRNKSENIYYTLNLKPKKDIVETNQIQNINHEKKLLECIKFPFIINLEYFFTDNSFIYFVHPLILGGDLFSHMKHLKILNEEISRFFAAQITLALEYLHHMNIIYRNLKLENVLICSNGYIKLIDFGISKLLAEGGRTYTVIGTPEYFAPEIVLNTGYGTAVDWWAMGVLIYEMHCGQNPFIQVDRMQMFELICSGSFKFTRNLSPELKDLLKNLLKVDLTKRIGNLKNGANDIKKHKWFALINWQQILSRKAISPYIPPPISATDLCQLKHPSLPNIDSTNDEYANYFKDF